MVAGCVAGGSRVVEFTNRGDDAHAVFVDLSRRVRAELPEVILGAGTIIDAPTAALFIAGGARFVVGQSYSEDVARLCNRRRIVYIPGCGSATEIAAAEELGCEIVKLFPAAAYDGPAFVRNFLAPSPGSKVMPTNVLATEEATRAWVAAGTAALGVGGHLYPADLVASRDRAEIAERTRRFLGWIRDARATPR
jgi:2-dehydro-3-deoxyphosphogluconate aldolase/(4S)-4-hydroxy-2-oxoglutarate aldolase